MKNIIKQAVMVLAFAVLAAPSFAAEITKGTKSYQTGSKKAETTAAAEQQKPEDVSKIAPAAGDQEPTENAKEKSFKEELRLPRKN